MLSWINVISALFCLAFFLATVKAFLLISSADIFKCSNSFFNTILMQPDPVPKSIKDPLVNLYFFIYFIVFSTKVSVSNLGIYTFLLTFIL